jgi:murein DD-endopeptidase MepM/ murein hydrolase activator NlpD
MIFKQALRAAAGIAIATGAMAAHPAMANETATTTQISGALKGEAAGPLGEGDKEFSQLFANWKQLEGGNDSLAAARPSVSVPAGMPVGGVRMSSSYGMRNHPVLGGRRSHNGVDLAGPTGTPVYATADGIVGKAERFGSYGKYIQIEHGGEMETRFAHLSGYNVVAGQRVRKGDLIGYIGSTGRSTGPHLHYEVRIAGEAVDPRPYMVADAGGLAAGHGGQGGPDE